MSKFSKLTSGLKITPGNQIVGVISTLKPDGKAALVLQAIAKKRSTRNDGAFGDWKEDGNCLTTTGSVQFSQNTYPVTLKIGAEEGLVLEDVEGTGQSMKPVKDTMVLQLGQDAVSRQARMDSYVNHLIGCWVVHGLDWYNRRQELVHQPYGFEKSDGLPKHFSFKVIDGAQAPKVTLGQLIDMGCTRSTHVGEWQGRHSTLIAAACDMPLTMHEFKKGGEDVCWFKDIKIGEDTSVWGPYCRWNDDLDYSQLNGWRKLALRCASPFAFHVHATRSLFAKAQLDSDFLLEKVGKARLLAMLELMVQKEPERFYRLIDENGKTWQWSRVENNHLVYGNDIKFNRDLVASSVVETLEDLQAVQEDMTCKMARKARVVLDPHAYIVMESLAMGETSVCVLSGRDMHRYLTAGGSSNMHKIRNDRLFLSLRDFFNVEKVDFTVYPPLSWVSGLHSQYSDLKSAPVESWLQATVQ